VVLAVAGVVLTVALSGSKSGSFAVGSCVKQSGSKATAVKCSEPGAYTVVSKVDRQDKCPDPGQPFVVVHHPGGKDDFFCLRPAK
jgi:hypothetical protein